MHPIVSDEVCATMLLPKLSTMNGNAAAVLNQDHSQSLCSHPLNLFMSGALLPFFLSDPAL